ncbi:class I SAM-dependent methyltransferase [Clostridium sp. 19966]|uniref:class I SAM-dependent methyltransferase n=1 Tax=Clostridium sp. 19966 TaxID=2768166 RepID=UPI0028DEACD1|nr:class I SAM-dependent methyltransferase [Clostridium sp. 19966]MDT8717191.1 class I SAM-dependent methyltransferase [Clostridium sp. 19966]
MSSVKYFDSIAQNWDVIRSEYFEEKLKYAAISKVDIDSKVCADLGCGTGFISLELARRANIVFSMDVSTNMLKQIYNKSKNENQHNIYPIKASMEDIPLFDNSVDVIFTNMAMHHVENPAAAMKEMNRILKPEGRVVISDVKEHNGEWAREEMFDVWLGFNNEQIATWLREAGFKNIEIENTDLSCIGYSSKGERTETGIFIATAVK